jgi:hypothetical protein
MTTGTVSGSISHDALASTLAVHLPHRALRWVRGSVGPCGPSPGVPGYTVQQSAVFLEEEGARLQPDMILVYQRCSAIACDRHPQPTGTVDRKRSQDDQATPAYCRTDRSLTSLKHSLRGPLQADLRPGLDILEDGIGPIRPPHFEPIDLCDGAEPNVHLSRAATR